MDVRAPLATLFATLAIASPAAGSASVKPGEQAPGACANAMFTDMVGTLDVDVLRGDPTPRRVYGLTGPDWLSGSPTRATCLFGGQGDDVLSLEGGGGIAHGEDGADVLRGSTKDDGLNGGDGNDVLLGNAGGDVLRGGNSVDGLYGAEGDDLLDAADGRAEVVDCGPGTDTALADGVDLVVSCERGQQVGKRLRLKRLERQVGSYWSTFHMRFHVPQAARAGEYRVLLAGTCDDGLRQIKAFPAPGQRLRRGQVVRVGLPAPDGGWCPGAVGGALVRAERCPDDRTCVLPRPVEPIALLAFTVR